MNGQNNATQKASIKPLKSEKTVKLLGVNIDLSELDERAKQVDSITNQLKDIDTNDKEERPDVNYIG